MIESIVGILMIALVAVVVIGGFVGGLVLIISLMSSSSQRTRIPSDDLFDPDSPDHALRTYQFFDGLDGDFDGKIDF